MRTRIRFPAVAIVIAAAAASLLAGCAASPPPVDRMAGEVARLAAVVPIVEELRVTDFEDSDQCRNLGYARGAYGFLEQDGCERDGTEAFDADALADHARLATAISASGVAIDRLMSATYSPDGVLETAWFRLSNAAFPDFWEYLYDPTGVVPKQDEPGRRDFTRVADGWWFVWSPDD